jgi:putative acyl-CoA dehydrogenase
VLDQQPLMQNVLADLALEQRRLAALTMRMARALDHRATDPHEDALVRLVTAVGKYWICKRTPQHAYEAMECIGGSGVMEDSPFPRLYREAPVNAIWEGSGNVQCLDVLRAMHKSPEVVEALLRRARQGARRRSPARPLAAVPAGELHDAEQLEYRARSLVDRMALALQAALLVQHAPTAVADAFCGSRLEGSGPRQYGTLPRGQLEALDLAGGRLGQVGDELDQARVLVGRQPVLDEGLELGLGGLAPGLSTTKALVLVRPSASARRSPPLPALPGAAPAWPRPRRG